MKNKILYVLLALTMVFSVACSSPESTQSETIQTDEVTTTQEQSEASTEQEDTTATQEQTSNDASNQAIDAGDYAQYLPEIPAGTVEDYMQNDSQIAFLINDVNAESALEFLDKIQQTYTVEPYLSEDDEEIAFNGKTDEHKAYITVYHKADEQFKDLEVLLTKNGNSLLNGVTSLTGNNDNLNVSTDISDEVLAHLPELPAANEVLSYEEDGALAIQIDGVSQTNADSFYAALSEMYANDLTETVTDGLKVIKGVNDNSDLIQGTFMGNGDSVMISLVLQLSQ